MERKKNSMHLALIHSSCDAGVAYCSVYVVIKNSVVKYGSACPAKGFRHESPGELRQSELILEMNLSTFMVSKMLIEDLQYEEEFQRRY